ncbi:hypothetical protein CRG98_030892 [Punica granatum]|uniref:Uncharacterized protein n=1 Tax=Punica granatum TaxID=22663 RepID=A0A2I0IXH0_PUNGR|nr:hypothetical protein CRG98_030892 [Punica granatum]
MWAGDLAICSTTLYSFAFMILMNASASSSVTLLDGKGELSGAAQTSVAGAFPLSLAAGFSYTHPERPRDLAVCIRFSRGDIHDEWSRRSHVPRESDCGFLKSIVDREGKGVVLRVLVPPRGACGDHVDARPRTRPMVRKGVALHIRGPDGIEGEPIAVNPPLDLVLQPPTIIESVPWRALMIFATFRLVLNGRVKIRAWGYRSNLIARKELSIYVRKRGRQRCVLLAGSVLSAVGLWALRSRVLLLRWRSSRHRGPRLGGLSRRGCIVVVRL